MGGLWVDYEQQTNIAGLFAVGECDYSIHGANRLGANSLLSCVYAGIIAGPAAVNFAKNNSTKDLKDPIFERERARQAAINEALKTKRGTENPRVLHEELGRLMTENVTVIRYNDRLRYTDEKIQELLERYERIDLNEQNYWATQAIPHARQLENMLHLARVITLGALNRDESRGAHYKPEFPERDDERFLKTTIATWTPEGPQLTYEDVDISLIKPRKRDYSKKKAAA